MAAPDTFSPWYQSRLRVLPPDTSADPAQCFLTLPGLIYLVAVPMWSRTVRFASAYAFAAVDLIYSVSRPFPTIYNSSTGKLTRACSFCGSPPSLLSQHGTRTV